MGKMKLNLLLEVADTPGQLINILNPLASFGANISSVIHQHDHKTKKGTIPIHLTIEADREILNKCIEAIEDKNIDILEIDGVLQRETQAILFIGDITTPNINETIDKINAIEDVKITGVNLKIANDLKDSVSKFNIETKNNKKQEAVKEIQKISDENNLIMIKEI
jgi:ACT domain-containing protein